MLRMHRYKEDSGHRSHHAQAGGGIHGIVI